MPSLPPLARLFTALVALLGGVARWIAGARQGTLTATCGTPLRYVRIRRPGRPTVVLIHGFSDRPESFLATARGLTAYDVVMPALPGFHHDYRDGVRYTVQSYARWTAEILDALGVRDAHVCGNSLGGATALMLATMRPDLVRSLVPLDTGGVEAPGVRSVHDEVRDGSNLFLVTTPRQIPTFLGRIFHRPPPVFGPMRALLAADLAARARAFEGIMNDLLVEGEDVAEHGAIVPLSEISVPTMVAWGDQDTLFPLAVGEHLVREIPRARLHVFEHTGHCPHLERPGALARACRTFWAEVDDGAPAD